MNEKYLNGKITLTSLAAPTAKDMEKIAKLSDQDCTLLLKEKIRKGKKSPLSTKSVDDIWDEALKKARHIRANKKNPECAV